MTECPECELELVEFKENWYKCPRCLQEFLYDLELESGLIYQRTISLVGDGETINYEDDL
jgi:hypothetical protein